MSVTPLLQAKRLVKSYHKNRIEVPVLRGVDLDLEERKITALVGRSGSGKSTLMHLLATLDRPDAGEVLFRGDRLDNTSPQRRDSFRNRDIGIIFQFYHLLPELSALENVLTSAMISHSAWSYFRNRGQLRRRATELMNRVGLGHRMHHKPSELSGGEMQRTAIARALMSEPSILLADEPTGNLDAETGHEILALLRGLNFEDGLTIVMVTHDESIAASVDRTVRLENGLIVRQSPSSALAGVA